MIIEKLSLMNWRGYRKCHSFSFKQGFNLVVGPNEAGKSTLFEALTRVMFDRHNSKSEDILNIRPWNSSLGPYAELVFSDKGHRYTIKKRFIQKPSCDLLIERNGEWVPDDDGDGAERKIQEILKGKPAARSALPENRGLAQALWYLQKEEPLPKSGDWVDGIKSDIATLIEIAVKRPEEDKIVKSISDGYNEIFTAKTGKLKASSELAKLQDKFYEISRKLEGYKETTKAITNFQNDLEENEPKLNSANTLLTDYENNAEREKTAEDIHRKKWKEEIEPGMNIIDNDLQICRSIQNYSDLINEKNRIERKSTEISKSEKDYRNKEKELNELHAPDKKEWNDFEDNWDQLQSKEAEARANAIRVKFDLPKYNTEIITQPEALLDEGEYLLKEPTSFKVGEIGSIHIRGGVSSLKDLNVELRRLHGIIDPYCSQYNVIDRQAFFDLYQRRLNLENEVANFKDGYDRLVAEIEGGTPEKRLETLNREIEEKSQIIQSAPENLKKLNENELKSKIIELDNAKTEFTTNIREEREKEEMARQKSETWRNTIADTKGAIETLKRNIDYNRGQIDAYTAQGLYSETSDLEALIEEIERQKEKKQLEADAIKLLYDMIIDVREEQSTQLAKPVSERVNKWLSYLTDDSYDYLELNEKLLPDRVHSKRFDISIPLKSLSYGTYEQIIVLLRLALGEILSKNERNLIVIDDRLVNADPERMKRLSVLLQEIANNSCQIIVASCNAAPYLGIKDVNIIQVPSDGKIS